jgi:lipopolysaccharide export system ATP-binding protein
MRNSTLETVALSKAYRGRKVVESVTLGLSQGEVVGLLGPNGAGKTTTFYIIVGLIAPDSGAVRVDSADITRLPMYQRARSGISYLPQEPSVFRKLTVEDNLRTISETLDLPAEEQDARVDALLEEFGIEHLRRQRAYTLSGGERRRLEIARALVLTPKFILLDEPFAGIDPLAVQEIQRIIVQLRERHIGVLVTDHNVRETLNITDRAYIINAGKILRAGSPEELSRDLEVKKVYLGENFRLN